MKTEVRGREFALKFLAPWNAHDTAAVLASLPEDFVWQFTAGAEPNGTVYRGKDQLRVALERVFETVPDIHYEIVDLHPGDSHLVMELLVTGNNRETGAVLNFQACDIVLFEGEQLREKRSYRKVVS